MKRTQALEKKDITLEFRILHLEDAPIDAELIEYELKAAGFAFTSRRVETKEAYRKALKEFSPDLILSDYDLPNYDGASALTDAAEQCPDVPFILVTGAVTEDRAIEILTSGAKDYVLKSRLARLVPAVQRALAESTEHKARRKAEKELRAAHKSLEAKVAERTAELRDEIEQHKRTEASLSRAKDLSEALNRITELLYSTFDPDRIIQHVVDVGAQLLGSETAVVSLRENDGWTVSCVNGMPAAMVGSRMTDLEEPHAVVAIDSLQPVAISDAWNDERVNHDHAVRHNVRAVLVAPLIGREGPLGVIFFNYHNGPHTFDPIEINFAAQLASNAAIALYNARIVNDLKRAEEELSAAKQRLDAHLDNSPMAVVEFDPRFRVIRWSREAERLFGWTAPEVMGRAITELPWVHEEDRQSVHQVSSDMLSGTRPRNLNVNRNYRKDGTVIYCEWYNSSIYDAQGRMTSVLSRVLDVTERSRAAKELKESEERLRALMMASSEVIYSMNPDWSQMRRLYGRGFIADTEKPNPSWLEEYIFPEDQTLVTAVIREAIRTRGIFEMEHRIRRVDGKVGWTHSRAIPLFDKKGEIVEWLGVAGNITERKQAEEALRESESRFRKVFEEGAVGIVISGPDARFISTNATFSKLIGYTPEELSCMTFRDITHPDHLAQDSEKMRELTEGVIPVYRTEKRYLTKCGDVIWGDLTVSCIRGEGGKLLYFLGTIQDITERKRIEEERERLIAKLEAANRELESFTYSASHDLRAPLRAISGFSANLAKTLSEKLTEEEMHRFDLIQDSTEKMNHLIDDLLALARISRTHLTKTTIDMNKLAKAVWQEQLAANPKRKIKMKQGDLPAISGDRSLIWQVFSNLLANAVKYTRKRKAPVIEIGGEIKGSENLYYVTDNGAGFDMKYRDKLFGVFQRLHPQSDYEGTGVGLAIVQRIVHRHGGRVWAEGKVNQGATFYFSLPNASA